MGKVLKIGLIAVGVLVGLVVAAVGVAFILSRSSLSKKYTVDEKFEVPLEHTQAELAEGKRLYISRGCGDCHGVDAGGKMAFEAGPLGSIYGTNLTQFVADNTVQDFERAVRHGLKPDGTPLLFMPSVDFWTMPDRQVALIAQYVKSVPKVDRPNQPSDVGLLAHILHEAGQFDLVPAENIDQSAPHPKVEVAPTKEYGKTLVRGCRGCHGEHLSGGPMPGAPKDMAVPQNITPDKTGLGTWSRDDFVKAMRTGVRPDGSKIDPFMPWKDFAKMTDTELDAIWAYLQTVPPRPMGRR